MKRVADAAEPDVVVPVIVVAVHVDLALVVPVERGVGMYEIPSMPPSLEF